MSAHQQVHASIHDIDLMLVGSNTLQDQNYLDQYIEEFGTGPLASISQATNFVFIDDTDVMLMLNARNAHYPKIKTNTVGLGLTLRQRLTRYDIIGLSGAFDYTNYHTLNFYQGVLSSEYARDNYLLTTNAYLPVGCRQSFNSNLDTRLVSLFGFDITLSNRIQDLFLGLSGSMFAHKDVKGEQSTVSIQAAYHFNHTLELGGAYQVMHGQDTSDRGFNIYAKLPLHESHPVFNSGLMPCQFIKRQLGSSITETKQSQ